MREAISKQSPRLNKGEKTNVTNVTGRNLNSSLADGTHQSPFENDIQGCMSEAISKQSPQQNMGGKTNVTNVAGQNHSSSTIICTDDTPVTSASPFDSGIQGCMRGTIPKQSPRCSNSRKTRNVLFGISTTVAIVCKHELCYLAYIATTAVAYLPQLLCFYLIVRIHKTYDPIRKSLSTNDILLLFTSSCEYVFFILQFIALIGTSLQMSYIHANGVSVYVKFFYPFLAVTQLSVQTLFLISVSAIHNSGKKLSTVIQAMTFFIGTVGVAQWWLIAIQRAATEKTVTLFCEFYLSFGSDTTQLIFLMLFPFTGLYHFHSAMVAFEIISRVEA